MKKYIGIIITGLMPLLLPAQLVMNSNFYMVLNGGTQANPTSVVLTNGTPAGITNNGTGWIISENEFNQVDWNIGTNAGIYKMPFGYSTSDYLPVTFDVTTGGTANGVVKFSTYHGASFDNSLYKPSDVNNTTDFGKADYSIDMVDRFWDIDANSYASKPSATITLTYIRTGAASEIVVPNNIIESSLMAQRFNSTLNKWDDVTLATNTDITAGATGNVSSGSVSPANLFRSWTLANDSTNAATGVPQIIAAEGITTWPNPTRQTLNIKFGEGQQGNAEIRISDAIGQELILKQQYISTGTVLPINVSSLAAGMYFIRISTETFTATSKFIKQ